MEKTKTLARWANFAEASRPLAALTAVWLTTAGHTMTFRELNAAHGWISSEGYSLHSAYLFAVTLALPLGPRIARSLGCYPTALAGLVLLAGASLANGLMLHAAWSLFVCGRVLAGLGAGLVIFACPRLIHPDWERPTAWASIVLPALGPPVIAGASQFYGLSSWEGAFLFEAILALFGLALLVSMQPPPERSVDQPGPLLYLLALVLANACLWYLLHWGHLHGWLEARFVLTALAGSVLGLVGVLGLAWPGLERRTIGFALSRLVLVGFAGFVQYFNASDMGVYGGLLVNFSPWQRSWLVWSLSLGAAAALALGEILGRRRPLRLPGALAGLLVLAGGMALARQTTLSWPFWSILNSVELNWFQAPQHWELAPARLLMGFGSAMVLFSALTHASPDPALEVRIRPRLQEVQFLGGAVSIGVLATWLLAGYQWEYAYATDRGFIQPQELSERTEKLVEVLAAAGEPFARRQAELLMFRAVNYQANNLLFADIYTGFLVASLILATLVLGAILFGRTPELRPLDPHSMKQ